MAFSILFNIFSPIPIDASSALRPAIITQPEDEFSPYRESEHFLFDIPSSYLRGVITPEQLGWYLGEMDKLYKAMAGLVGGADGWLPRGTRPTGDRRKILMNYDPTMSGPLATGYLGINQMNLSPILAVWIAINISRREISYTPVHELGHNFGPFPTFNVEWTADFLSTATSIITGIALEGTESRVFGNDGTLDSWYQLCYNWQARTDIDWSNVTERSKRYTSILTCAILNFVREYGGWNVISQVFGSYHDGSYPYDGQKYGGSDTAIRVHEFIDRIDYFGGIDFRAEYLDYRDWLEYFESEFPVTPIGFVTIAGREYPTHLTTFRFELVGKTITDDDIKQIEQMWLLESLNLSNTQISDLTRLSGLAKLENLNALTLSLTQINDITPLSEFTNLRNLNLNDNNINDLKSLSELTNLRNLRLMNNSINNLSPLSKLTNLTLLDLENNEINDLTPLYGLKNPLSMWLRNNPITLAQVRALQAVLPTGAIIRHNAVCNGCCNACIACTGICCKVCLHPACSKMFY
jgi:hypothetical protein